MRKKITFLILIILSNSLIFTTLYASEKIDFSRDQGSYGMFFYNDSQGNNRDIYYGTYVNEDGVAGYCLQAGRNGPGSGTTYYEDTEFDISNCSSNWSYDCSLAYAVGRGQALGLSDEAIQLGLRLVAAYSVDAFSEQKGGDGWYDDESGITNTAEIYKNTADAIINHSYDGTYNSYNEYGQNGGNLVDVLYAQSDEAQAILNQAVGLFTQTVNQGNRVGYVDGYSNTTIAKNGIDGLLAFVDGNDKLLESVNVRNTTLALITDDGSVAQPSMKITGVQGSGSNVVITIQSNNSSNTTVDIPSQVNGYKVTGYTINNTGGNYQINLNVDIGKATSKGDCVFFDFNIDYNDPNNAVNNVKKYNAAGGTKQDFIAIENSGKGSTSVSYNYCPEEGGECCPNTGVKTSVPSVCADEVSTGTIEDPEICAIANACGSNVKKNHDFSGLVNTAYCNLYCREEILFTFMDKTEVIAGRQFVYDVRPSYAETAEKLSTIIQGTRECAAPNINFEKWEKDYIAANNAIASAWNNLKKWEALHLHIGQQRITGPHSCKHSTNCCEHAPTYECGTEEKPKTCGGECIKAGCSCSAPDYTIWYWGTNGSGPFPYNASDKKGRESRVNAIYTHGSCSANCCGGGCKSVDGSEGVKVIEGNYKAAVNSYRRVLERREKLLADIQNCNVMEKFIYEPRDQTYYVAQGEDTYTYTGYNNVFNELVSSYTFDSNVDITYEDENSELISVGKSGTSLIGVQQGWTKAENVCSSCGELNLSGGLSTKEEERLVCTGSETGANCDVVMTNVPDNLATDLKITKEQTYWQSAKFYTQIYTGKVSTSSNGQGYWIQLDDYIYPIELNKKNGVYGVWVKYTQLGSLKQFPDVDFTCAFEVINESTIYECDPLYDDYCEIECDPSNGEKCDIEDYPYAKLGFVVRSIDLNEMFPNDSRPKGMNWENSLNVIKAIQELGDTVYTTSKPQYTIYLTKENLKNIKSYNAGTNYGDFSITCNSFNCTSDFLTDLSNNSNYAKKVDLLKRVDDNMKKDSEGNWYKYGKDGVTE